MMNENQFKYYSSEGTLYRLHIEDDPDPESPRSVEFTDTNIGTMVCWHKRYSLGDPHNYENPEEFLFELLYQVCQKNGPEPVINFLKSGKSKTAKLAYHSSTGEWMLSEKRNWLPKDFETVLETRYKVPQYEYQAFSISQFTQFLQDCISSLALQEIQELLRNAGYTINPIYLYDHTSLRISISSFHDPWDSGQIGYIYTTLDRAKEILGDNPSWKQDDWDKTITDCFRNELSIYNMYLSGECYGCIVEQLSSDGTWTECESCWGYYTDAADPLEEIAREMYSGPFYDKLSAIS